MLERKSVSGFNKGTAGKFTQVFGGATAILIIFMMYGVPVYLSYQISSIIEPVADSYLLIPLASALEGTAYITQHFLMGDYGIVSLGLYSVVWALPVVLFISLSISLTEGTGLQNKLINMTAPLLRKIGLSGTDYVPVISGYGCNVVAVLQTKGCQACSRRQCVSMISYGSACSYQIGATLSIFNAAKIPWMFIPYIMLLFIIGVLHTRLWYKKPPAIPFINRNYALRKPDWAKVSKRWSGIVAPFFKQALPIFLVICFFAFLLNESGFLLFLVQFSAPLFHLLSLPPESGLGIFFSVLRKDGILLFNEGGGSLLASFTAAEIFIVVYLASTLSGCLVTLFTIAKELGCKFAISHTIKQAATSVVTTGILAAVFKFTGIM